MGIRAKARLAVRVAAAESEIAVVGGIHAGAGVICAYLVRIKVGRAGTEV